MQPKRGKFIVFEGLDRSGKSTQCERLGNHLRSLGHAVLNLRFPDRATPIGQMINSYLSGQSQQENHVIHLLFSANRWEHAKTIEDALAAGTTVVVDRYYYSGAVYSAAKEDPRMSLEWCRQQEVGLPRPDICLFLDIDADAAASRGDYGSERYERQDMQDRVRQLFTEMRTHVDEREDIVVVDAAGDMDSISRHVKQTVQAAMDRVDREGLPLRFVSPW